MTASAKIEKIKAHLEAHGKVSREELMSVAEIKSVEHFAALLHVFRKKKKLYSFKTHGGKISYALRVDRMRMQ
jgi:hypothetical protein